MGLFETSEQKKAKQEQLVNVTMDYYGLGELSGKDRELAYKILDRLSSSLGAIGVGTHLKGNGVDGAKLDYLRMLVEQNILIIRKLDEISRKLDK